MVQGERVELGKVLAFAAPGARARRPVRADAERGAILLFTGVRYERPAAAALPKPDRPGGSLAG